MMISVQTVTHISQKPQRRLLKVCESLSLSPAKPPTRTSVAKAFAKVMFLIPVNQSKTNRHERKRESSR